MRDAGSGCGLRRARHWAHVGGYQRTLGAEGERRVRARDEVRERDGVAISSDDVAMPLQEQVISDNGTVDVP